VWPGNAPESVLNALFIRSFRIRHLPLPSREILIHPPVTTILPTRRTQPPAKASWRFTQHGHGGSRSTVMAVHAARSLQTSTPATTHRSGCRGGVDKTAVVVVVVHRCVLSVMMAMTSLKVGLPTSSGHALADRTLTRNQLQAHIRSCQQPRARRYSLHTRPPSPERGQITSKTKPTRPPVQTRVTHPTPSRHLHSQRPLFLYGPSRAPRIRGHDLSGTTQR